MKLDLKCFIIPLCLKKVGIIYLEEKDKRLNSAFRHMKVRQEGKMSSKTRRAMQCDAHLCLGECLSGTHLM